MRHRTEAAADARIAALFTAIAARAAAAIMRFDCRNVSIRRKDDQSPVTAADEAAEKVILEGLAAELPGLPVVSEESAGVWRDRRPDADYVLVDPLDGTAEFIAGRDEYTVNIALIREGTPVIGVVAAPALDLLWCGTPGLAERVRIASGAPQDRTAIRSRAWPEHERVAAVSRSHYEAATAAFLERFAPVASVSCGSALKFCRVAEGTIDIYPRLAPTSEWDVAAGHALVAAAGGAVTAPDGSTLYYGRGSGFRVPGFVAWGDAVAAKTKM